MSDTTMDAVMSSSQTNDVRKVVIASLIGSTVEWYDFFYMAWWQASSSTTFTSHRITKQFPSCWPTRPLR